MSTATKSAPPQNGAARHLTQKAKGERSEKEQAEFVSFLNSWLTPREMAQHFQADIDPACQPKRGKKRRSNDAFKSKIEDAMYLCLKTAMKKCKISDHIRVKDGWDGRFSGISSIQKSTVAHWKSEMIHYKINFNPRAIGSTCEHLLSEFIPSLAVFICMDWLGKPVDGCEARRLIAEIQQEQKTLTPDVIGIDSNDDQGGQHVSGNR